MTKDSNKNYPLSNAIYEGLRWVTVALLPTIGAVISGLNAAWNWGLPIEAISTTIDIIGMALGALFLGSKLSYDKKAGQDN